jgi:cytosol alanyl aminopeptidase
MIRFSCVVLVALAAGTLLAQSSAPGFRLPGGVVPLKHTIEITVDPRQDRFSGESRIEVQIRAPEKVLWVNGKDLTVQGASIRTGKRMLAAKAESVGGEFIRLETEQPVPAGRAVLSIRYQAPLSDTAVAGPYRRQIEGEWYAFTIFTPIDARRAFPCFDQPDFKTPWEISIRINEADKAYANGPLDRVTNEPGGRKLCHFAATQPLPAEVVAFAVGPFDELYGGKAGKRGTPVRVITAKGHGDEGRQATLVTRDILPRLEAFTGLSYPFTKLYHIGLPAGAFGATENPGLITYQSRSLLMAPGTETSERQLALRRLQAHEISHMWFGNLVTQSTWEDVYLSEGFATWTTAKVMDQEQPPARRRLTAVMARERIMSTDAGPETHPVRWAMKSREDLYGKGRGVYNQIAYQKGAAILWMLDGWLGEDRVQTGVREYLKNHAYGNASTSDLVSALRRSSGSDPSAVLQSFLDRPGIPGIRFEVQCRPGSRPQLVLEQTRAAQTWTLPVCWTGDGVKSACTVMDSLRSEIPLSATTSCPAWIYPNAGATGYYRTEWTVPQLSALASGGLARLSAPERLTLVYDLLAGRKNGSVGAGAAQSIMAQLAADTVPEVANAAKGLPSSGPQR